MIKFMLQDIMRYDESVVNPNKKRKSDLPSPMTSYCLDDVHKVWFQHQVCHIKTIVKKQPTAVSHTLENQIVRVDQSLVLMDTTARNHEPPL